MYSSCIREICMLERQRKTSELNWEKGKVTYYHSNYHYDITLCSHACIRCQCSTLVYNVWYTHTARFMCMKLIVKWQFWSTHMTNSVAVPTYDVPEPCQRSMLAKSYKSKTSQHASNVLPIIINIFYLSTVTQLWNNVPLEAVNCTNFTLFKQLIYPVFLV